MTKTLYQSPLTFKCAKNEGKARLKKNKGTLSLLTVCKACKLQTVYFHHCVKLEWIFVEVETKELSITWWA